MAAVSVAADNVRIDSMDAATNVTDIGGGAGAAAEPDIVYQGAGSVSRKVGTAQRGFGTSGGGTFDVTAARRRTVMLKAAIGNWSALDPQTTPGLEFRIGSSSTAYYAYNASIPEVYPPRGGFIVRPIDPNVAAHRDATSGTPALASAAWFAILADFSATSKAENVVLDAVDHGAGLNLTGGDGADPDGTFADFVSHDEGTSGNRYGYVTTAEGILFVYGRLWIGQNTSQTAVETEFTDSNTVLVFPDGLFDAGFSGLGVDISLAGTASSITDCIFNGRGDTTGVDTRPTLDVTGTLGVATFTGCSFDSFASFNLTKNTTISGGQIANSGQVTHGTATISGVRFTGCTAASGIVSTNPVSITDCRFDGHAGHAIEITVAGTYNLDALTFTGFGADGTTTAAIYNNSGGAVTLNVINGGSTPTVRNGTGATTTVNQSVPVKVTAVDATTGAAVSGVRVRVVTAPGGVEVLAGVSDAQGEVSGTYSGTTPQAITGVARKASSAPLYKSAGIFGSITANGLDATAVMISDE